eukprot:scaffold4419_cov128-Isochrysis_galbana.AAC.7
MHPLSSQTTGSRPCTSRNPLAQRVSNAHLAPPESCHEWEMKASTPPSLHLTVRPKSPVSRDVVKSSEQMEEKGSPRSSPRPTERPVGSRACPSGGPRWPPGAPRPPGPRRRGRTARGATSFVWGPARTAG